jgi:hypothetical protein
MATNGAPVVHDLGQMGGLSPQSGAGVQNGFTRTGVASSRETSWAAPS